MSSINEEPKRTVELPKAFAEKLAVSFLSRGDIITREEREQLRKLLPKMRERF